MADSGAYVLSIDALEEMRNALLRYQGDARSTLPQMATAFGRTEERLRERAEYWRRQLQTAERNYALALDNLRRCEASGTRDRNGRHQAPDCRRDTEMLASARRQVDHVRQQLATVQQLTRQFRELQVEHSHNVQRFTYNLDHQIPSACTFLRSHRNALLAYIQTNAPRTSVAAPSPSTGARQAAVLAGVMTGAATVTLAALMEALRSRTATRPSPPNESASAVDGEATPQLYVMPGTEGVTVVVANTPSTQTGPLPDTLSGYVTAQLPTSRAIVTVSPDAQDDIALFTNPSGSTWVRVDHSPELLDLLYRSFPGLRSFIGPRGKTIVLIRTSAIDDQDTYVHSDADFKKASPAEIETAYHLLIHIVLPLLAVGAAPDDFDRIDELTQRAFPNSLRRVYDLFYGDEAIRLEQRVGGWSINHGYHRFNVAKSLGLPYIPANLIAEEEHDGSTSERGGGDHGDG